MQAVFGTYAYGFPAIFLSGFVFPIEGIPPFFQALSYLVPARYLIEVLRGVMLKGVGWEVLWPDLLALAPFAVLVLFRCDAVEQGRQRAARAAAVAVDGKVRLPFAFTFAQPNVKGQGAEGLSLEANVIE